MKLQYLPILLFAMLSSVIFAKDYKVLVLPSGGATAVISAALLEHIEEQTGKKTYHLFDEIWGSSAGAIIAGFAGKGVSATKIVSFFEYQFSSFYKAYCIRQAVHARLGSGSIADMHTPIRILTAASSHLPTHNWNPYDFSTDGAGSCT